MPADGLYGRNFGNGGTLSKPSCYADVSKYDETDPECRACPFRGTCRYQVEQKLSRVQPTSSQTSQVVRPTMGHTQQGQPQQTQGPVVVPPADQLRTPVGQDDTYMGALAHNSFLSALEAVMTEAVYSVRTIPRRRYPNPFK